LMNIKDSLHVQKKLRNFAWEMGKGGRMWMDEHRICIV